MPSIDCSCYSRLLPRRLSATVHLLPILAVIFPNAGGAGAASGETGVAAADTTSQTLTFEQDSAAALWSGARSDFALGSGKER